MKIKIIIPILLLLAMPVSAQCLMQPNLNCYRSGDKLYKQQIEYKESGRSGADVLWDISKMDIVNKKYRLSYSEMPSSPNIVAGTEHDTRYYYEQSKDSIVLTGYENNMTKISYDSPELLLKFPMRYGSSVSGEIHGKGKYCERYTVNTSGTYKTVADAYGMLILPEGDTLRNVLRLHTVKHQYEKIDSMDNNGDIVTSDTYRWYAAGYRYPIFETVRTAKGQSSNAKDAYTTAYYCSPSGQVSLDLDDDNISLRERLSQVGSVDGGKSGDNVGFKYNISNVSDGTKVNFDYYLSRESTVEYGLYTAGGITIYHHIHGTEGAGEYNCSIDMDSCQRGIYVFHIDVNGKKYIERIVKK